MGWWRRHHQVVLVSAAVVSLTGLSWSLATSAYRTLIRESFHGRSLAYVQTFAASASPWLDPIQPAMLQSAARFMLVGSARYVQVAVEGQLMVDERMAADAELDLAPLPRGAVAGIQSSTPRGVHVLDIAVPLSFGEALDQGYVRVGIDETSVLARSRSLALWSGLLAVAVDLAVLGALWWLFGVRVVLSRRTSDRQTSLVDPSGAAIVGELRIDTAGRRIYFKDQPVRLTPKQYALIEFLAADPDRVFTDREIVDGVWTTSTYADSKDVKQYVYLVRRRLEAIHPSGKRLIETVPGFGYRLASQIVDEELTDV